MITGQKLLRAQQAVQFGDAGSAHRQGRFDRHFVGFDAKKHRANDALKHDHRCYCIARQPIGNLDP
jgi:hypothetical protein